MHASGKKKKKKSRPGSTAAQVLKDLELSNFALLTIAGIVNAFGVTCFLLPVKLYDSGISGLSMLLDQISPEMFGLSFFLLILNIPIFLFGLRRQGWAFTIYSSYAVGIYSLFSYINTNIWPIDLNSVSPLAGNDLFLCAIFGGLISGVGSGLAIRYGGAIDGIDVLSVVFAKRIGISIGSFVMIFNAVLYVICGLIMESWILPLYSIVTYFIGSKTVDFVVEGLDHSMCAMVVTSRAGEIVEALSEEFPSSGTIVKAIGGYSKEEKQILFFIINHFQINKLKKIVAGIDDKAFISIQDVSDIVKHPQKKR